ncbi:DUF6537 domain-containing protein [Acinetobacter baumannii]|uniref:DUF6537 domain-containing protein n=1 Tax=Acinetobacter baumannii TaxID=470 RepID=UPI0035E2350B
MAAALALAQLPDAVRGYGHVKLAALDRFDAEWERQLAAYRSGQAVELRRRA